LIVKKDKDEATRCLIATAHHADDQLETFLHKLLRGVSLSHLRPVSIPPSIYPPPPLPSPPLPFPSLQGQMLPMSENYIRPLLQIHKHELVDYLQSQNLTWMEDASNLSKDYTRNKIRLDVIPTLSEIAGGNKALHRSFPSLSLFCLLIMIMATGG
jgi:tRNA(Ile)-lysidine synthase